MNAKLASASHTIMNEIVLPNDTNTLNNLMGGRLLHLMDIGAAMAAQKHSNRIVVTASVDNVSFKAPIRLGDVVTIHAKITRSFNSSIVISILFVISVTYYPNINRISRMNTRSIARRTRLFEYSSCF